MKDWTDLLIKSGVTNPSRYSGGEFFPRPPKPPKPGDLKIALTFPEVYEVGMSNHGLALLYSALRDLEGVFVDRLFAPWPDLEAAIRGGALPLFSRDLGLPASEFDVLALSLPSELDYTNVLTMLDLAGLPLRRAELSVAGPLVVAGGLCASHPEPLAPFIDCFLLGDGEALLGPLVETLKRVDFAGTRSRRAALEALDGLPGAYVPALHVPVEGPGGMLVHPGLRVKKQNVAVLGAAPGVSYFPIPSCETVFDRVSLELTRGCVQGCRFCEAGFFYRPLRDRDGAELLEEARVRLAESGMEELGLAALSTADRPDLEPLVTGLLPLMEATHTNLSLSSLRAYGVSDKVLEVMKSGRTTSLTLAPESGARLRPSINKSVTDGDLIGAVERMASAGWDRVKLYFMLGLPGEEDQDAEAIAALAAAVHGVGSRYRGRRFVTAVSCAMFVPRPNTAFQWEPMASKADLYRRVGIIKGRLPRGVEFKWHDQRTSALETVLARGDRRVALLIEEAWKAGARFDAWAELFKEEAWTGAFERSGVKAEDYIGALDEQATLPWEHMEIGVSKRYLQRELERSRRLEPTGPCHLLDGSKTCHGCGVPCEALPPPPPALVGRPSVPKVQTATKFVKVRGFFSKDGPARLIGNLDLIRVLTRTLRRSGLSLAYTEGFHPRLKISMGPSLPLGHAGAQEWFEVHLANPLPPVPELLQGLAPLLPAGLEIRDLQLVEGQPSLRPRSARYRVWLTEAPPTGTEELKLRLAQRGLKLDRKGALVDLSGGLLGFALEGAPGAPELSLELALEKAPRPEEVVEALGLTRGAIALVRREGFVF
jgi:radical SAM family uncharacterized protein/radical SAM-linked protein